MKRKISQSPKCTSQIWKSAVIGLRFFPLKSAAFMGQERVMNLLEHLHGRLLDSVITPTWDGMGSFCRKILRESL